MRRRASTIAGKSGSPFGTTGEAPRGYVLLEERGVDGQRSIRDGDSVIGE